MEERESLFKKFKYKNDDRVVYTARMNSARCLGKRILLATPTKPQKLIFKQIIDESQLADASDYELKKLWHHRTTKKKVYGEAVTEPLIAGELEGRGYRLAPIGAGNRRKWEKIPVLDVRTQV